MAEKQQSLEEWREEQRLNNEAQTRKIKRGCLYAALVFLGLPILGGIINAFDPQPKEEPQQQKVEEVDYNKESVAPNRAVATVRLAIEKDLVASSTFKLEKQEVEWDENRHKLHVVIRFSSKNAYGVRIERGASAYVDLHKDSGTIYDLTYTE